MVANLGPNLLIDAMIAVGASAAPTYARVTRGAGVRAMELAINLMGDGLRDALDPRMSR